MSRTKKKARKGGDLVRRANLHNSQDFPRQAIKEGSEPIKQDTVITSTKNTNLFEQSLAREIARTMNATLPESRRSNKVQKPPRPPPNPNKRPRPEKPKPDVSAKVAPGSVEQLESSLSHQGRWVQRERAFMFWAAVQLQYLARCPKGLDESADQVMQLLRYGLNAWDLFKTKRQDKGLEKMATRFATTVQLLHYRPIMDAATRETRNEYIMQHAKDAIATIRACSAGEAFSSGIEHWISHMMFALDQPVNRALEPWGDLGGFVHKQHEQSAGSNTNPTEDRLNLSQRVLAISSAWENEDDDDKPDADESDDDMSDGGVRLEPDETGWALQIQMSAMSLERPVHHLVFRERT